MTNAQGQASCSVTPNEPGGGYTVTGSFAGSTGTTVLLPSSGHNCFQVNKAPTTLTYAGPTQVFQGGTITLTSTLTSNGSPVAGQPVVMTLGSGKSAQSCTGTRHDGVATCTVTVNQVQGSVAVTASYGGNTYYQSSSASSTEGIGCSGGGSGGGGSGGGGSGGGGFLRWHRWRWSGRRLPASGRGLRAGLLLRFPLWTVVL